jgi:ABC transporter substrate binding protein (PQQ-dependent alcohol dehydrogenase system)
MDLVAAGPQTPGARLRDGIMRRIILAICGSLSLVLLADAPAAGAEPVSATITYLGKAEPPSIPLSLVEPVLTDDGIQGARLGVADNQTTGRFLKHEYRLVERLVPAGGDLAAVFQEGLAAGERLYIADLGAEDLLPLVPAAEQVGAILFNSRAMDDALRLDGCSPALFHTAPSRAMETDALAQYLVWKRWMRWFLIRGERPADVAYADAIKRSAAKFGAKIVEERVYKYVEGARRTDTGHVQVQSQMPVFTQAAPEHDVVVAADESDVFGEYLEYRTWDPRPVVGTAGLVASVWSRVHEQWGGTQLQRRFERQAKRWMTDRDFSAWVAARAIGEAVTRAQTSDVQKLRSYMLADEFSLGAFKGQGLSFRRWNQQLRQPVLLVTPRMLVSVSPQDQFLHQRTPLDTLGFDEPESRCRLNS